jgi:hypothetical protein
MDCCWAFVHGERDRDRTAVAVKGAPGHCPKCGRRLGFAPDGTPTVGASYAELARKADALDRIAKTMRTKQYLLERHLDAMCREPGEGKGEGLEEVLAELPALNKPEEGDDGAIARRCSGNCVSIWHPRDGFSAAVYEMHGRYGWVVWTEPDGIQVAERDPYHDSHAMADAHLREWWADHAALLDKPEEE